MKLLMITGFMVWIALFTSCSEIDIDDEQAVMNELQGTWIGYEQHGDLYRHIKLTLLENTYNGWLTYTDYAEEPEWTPLPSEHGTFSISAVLTDPADAAKYRRLSFAIPKSCCGDNSITAKTLSQLLAFKEGKGLHVADGRPMIRE